MTVEVFLAGNRDSLLGGFYLDCSCGRCWTLYCAFSGIILC